MVSEGVSVSELLSAPPAVMLPHDYGREQRKDKQLVDILNILQTGTLLESDTLACKIVLKAPLFAVVDNNLYYVNPKHCAGRRAVVPTHLQLQIMEESHRGPTSGHFSGHRLFATLSRHWWWESTCAECIHLC